MSEDSGSEPTRRRLNKRQSDTVDRLVEAAVVEVRATGYAKMTVRNVASRADVAPATAYIYFSSKSHLIAEVFWRRLQSMPTPPSDEANRIDRVVSVLAGIALLLSNEPELSAACTSALLSEDPEVEPLRIRIGTDIRSRLVAALGEDYDPAELDTLQMLYSGALLHAGMGFLSYEKIVVSLQAAATLVLRR
ncbi:MAG: helix-turn-helix domain-containing protein [Rhodococcus sp. (in: high G+C Gram-positive bacteria)]